MAGDEAIPTARRGLLRILIVAIGVIGLLVGGALLLRAIGGGLPQINEADLTRARERWNSEGPKDYRLTAVISGRQTGEIKIEVRDGRPTAMTRNGTPMTQARTWEPWTVPGMFDTLETDFDNAAHATEKFGGGEVVMRAEFDATYGYPRRYLHQILGRHGDLEWEVTEFAADK